MKLNLQQDGMKRIIEKQKDNDYIQSHKLNSLQIIRVDNKKADWNVRFNDIPICFFIQYE